MKYTEDNIQEIITVIRTGILHVKNVSKQTIEELNEWCNEREKDRNDILADVIRFMFYNI